MSSNFQKNIQNWVTLDNQIKTLNQQAKELRNNRNALTNNIFTYAESNNLENAVIQISDGKLKFQNVKQTAPLTFKIVKEVLDECIDNEEHVNTIIKAIKDKRESKYVYDIRRTYS
jgi:arginine decarboxylase-like protein